MARDTQLWCKRSVVRTASGWKTVTWQETDTFFESREGKVAGITSDHYALPKIQQASSPHRC